MEETGKHSWNKWVKWAVAAGIIFVIAIGLRLFLQSNILFEWIRDTTEEQVNSRINGSLSIHSMNGDLLNGFTATGMSLIDESEDSLVLIDTLSVDYNLFSLIKSPHTLDRIAISGMDIYLEQDPDSVWNVMKLLKTAEQDEQADDPLLWALSKIDLNKTSVHIRSNQLLPDGFLDLTGLKASAAAGVNESGFFGTLNSLDFELREGRLPEPILFALNGSAEENSVTLESLVINTGRSMLRAAGSYNDGEGDITANADVNRISWRDLAAYADELPLQQDLTVELGISGSLNDVNLSLTASAPGLEHLQVNVSATIDETVSVTGTEIEVRNLNAPQLTGKDQLPLIDSLSYFGEGLIHAAKFDEMSWSGDLNLRGLRYDGYSLDLFTLNHDINSERLQGRANLIVKDQDVNILFDADNLFGDVPDWSAEIESRRLNLADWMNDPEFDSRLNIAAVFSGKGFSPEQFELESELSVEGERFTDQSFKSVQFSGTITQNTMTGIVAAVLEESEANANFDIQNWQTEPEYDFVIAVKRFNLAELAGAGLDSLPTYLNGTLSGNGSSFDPEQLLINATARFDSSAVNGERIETLRADVRINHSILFVDDAKLESPIADASISLRQHLFNLTDPENRLNFNTTLNNLQPLAALFGLTNLQTEGTVNGNLTRNNAGILQFDAEAELSDIALDTVLTIAELKGSMTAFLKDNPEADIQIELVEPVINTFPLQDITLNTVAVLSENALTGRMGFDVTSDEQTSLAQKGEFRTDFSSWSLRTDQLDFSTEARTLSLAHPFNIHFENETLRVDTLRIESPEKDAQLTFWAPHLDSLRQEIGLEANNINMGAMQSVILDDPFFNGLLSGSFLYYNSPDDLNILTDGRISDIIYQEGEADSIRFNVRIEKEWLQGIVEGWHENSELFYGNLKVPFVPGDPLAFDDQFFDREIEGTFDLFDTNLSYWLNFTGNKDAFSDTEATLGFSVNLAGQAGSPRLDGNFLLRDGILSGIRVDSIGMDFNYLHDEKEVSAEGFIIAQQNPVLRFDAMLPFIIDLKSTEVLFPGNEDSVRVNLSSDDFNLAVLNDFVDRDLVRQISGRLNSDISVTGTIGNLEPNGRIALTNGSMRILPAGITLSEIGSQIYISPDSLELQQFSIRSGPGRIRASGIVKLDNLSPGEIDLNIRGNQFRAANTSQYNAIIDLNASLNGTTAKPVLRGDLTFLSGFLNLQNFGEQSVEDIQLEGEEAAEAYDLYEALAMEMTVGFERGFFIRNQQYLDMEIELGGEVDLVKDVEEDMQMFGNLEGVRGYARPLGKNFVLDEANIMFSGPVDNPQLNVITRYEPPQYIDVRIFYIIEGTAQEPEFRFDSEPQLELQDIISYTLFGKPFYELESWEQVVAGSGSGPSATGLALDLVLDRVETLASQRLGIDVVQIDNSGSGSTSTTSIKTGWYLNRRTFFAILNEISGSKPKTLFMLEYMLTENLELLITQGDDSREGVDLRWNYDY